MSHDDFDDRVRLFGVFATRRGAVALMGGLGLAASDRGALGKKKKKYCK
jgi:hypothetical protein